MLRLVFVVEEQGSSSVAFGVLESNFVAFGVLVSNFVGPVSVVVGQVNSFVAVVVSAVRGQESSFVVVEAWIVLELANSFVVVEVWTALEPVNNSVVSGVPVSSFVVLRELVSSSVVWRELESSYFVGLFEELEQGSSSVVVGLQELENNSVVVAFVVVVEGLGNSFVADSVVAG